jgi:hypothetical protein
MTSNFSASSTFSATTSLRWPTAIFLLSPMLCDLSCDLAL